MYHCSLLQELTISQPVSFCQSVFNPYVYPLTQLLHLSLHPSIHPVNIYWWPVTERALHCMSRAQPPFLAYSVTSLNSPFRQRIQARRNINHKTTPCEPVMWPHLTIYTVFLTSPFYSAFSKQHCSSLSFISYRAPLCSVIYASPANRMLWHINILNLIYSEGWKNCSRWWLLLGKQQVILVRGKHTVYFPSICLSLFTVFWVCDGKMHSKGTCSMFEGGKSPPPHGEKSQTEHSCCQCECQIQLLFWHLFSF